MAIRERWRCRVNRNLRTLPAEGVSVDHGMTASLRPATTPPASPTDGYKNGGNLVPDRAANEWS